MYTVLFVFVVLRLMDFIMPAIAAIPVAAVINMADHVIKLRDGAVRHNERNEHRISAADLEW